MRRRTRLEYRLFNLHYGTVAQRRALLAWISKPKFKNRKPTPDELVKECRRKNSPLYGLMEVGQKRAAEKYWRQTAQDIIRHIHVVRVDIRTEEVLTQPVRAFIPVRVSQAGRIKEKDYIPVQRIANNPSLKQSVLERAHSDFLAWFQRYKRYSEFMKEFSPVITAYQKLQRKLEQTA